MQKKNAEKNKAEITFIETDILNTEASNKNISTTFDIIISNPPYIKASEKELMTKPVLDNEPHLALFVEGNDEIIFYKKIIDLCTAKLNTNGKLYFELNPLTANTVLKYAKESKLFKIVDIIKDMSGKDRFLRAEKA